MSCLANMLKLLLITCTLGYTNAWAFEAAVTHKALAPDAGVVDINKAGPDKTAPGGEEQGAHGCAHCCHANAHLLAINSNPHPYPARPDGMVTSRFAVSAASHIPLPDPPPPRFLF